MSAGRHRAGRQRPPLLVLAAVLVAVVLALVQIPGAEGAFVAKVNNPTNTASTNEWFTCGAYATSPDIGPALFAYPLNDTLLTAADVSGRGNTGSYSVAGFTRAQPNSGACVRDATAYVQLTGTTNNSDGLTGTILGPGTAVAAPNVFTEEIWFKTTVGGGRLIGYGAYLPALGKSNQYDRHLYLTDAGNLIYGVNQSGGVNTLTTPRTYLDGKWHFAAATLSSAGMALYVDGALITSRADVTAGQSFSGYWRIGFDNLDGWPSAPLRYHYTGSLAWASVYTTALTATQIAQQYVAGT